MAFVFNPEVRLPPQGLQLPNERSRCAAFLILLSKVLGGHIPIEIGELILEMAVLTTPNFGMDPVLFYRWFYKQQCRAVPMDPKLEWGSGKPFTEPPDVQFERFEECDEVEFCIPRLRAFPKSLSWTDLSCILIKYVSGSRYESHPWLPLCVPFAHLLLCSMCHRRFGGKEGEIGGTCRWYPEDWDLVLPMSYSIGLFELWLKAVFRRVHFECPNANNSGCTHSFGSCVINEEGRLLEDAPCVRSYKWTVGGHMMFNVTLSHCVHLESYDFIPAATAMCPPFDTIYETFRPPSLAHPDGYNIVKFETSEGLAYSRSKQLQVTFEWTEQQRKNYVKFMVDRSTKRTEKYKARYPDVLVAISPDERHLFYYHTGRINNIYNMYGRDFAEQCMHSEGT